MAYVITMSVSLVVLANLNARKMRFPRVTASMKSTRPNAPIVAPVHQSAPPKLRVLRNLMD